MDKPERELIKFRADPILRRAIKLRAAFEDRDQQDVISEILEGALDNEIKELRRRDLEAAKAPGGKAPKKS